MKKIITFCCALLGFGAMATAGTTSLDFEALVTAGAETGSAITQDMLNNSGNEWINIGSGAKTFNLQTTTTIRMQGGISSAYYDVCSITVGGAGTITISIQSTGGSNHSAFALGDGTNYLKATSFNSDYVSESNGYDALGVGDGNANEGVVFDENVYCVVGNVASDVVWTVEQAGTYIFYTAIDGAFNRGADISGISVTTEEDVDDENEDLEDLDILALFGTSGYGSTFEYDEATNTATIVYEDAWKGCGIWGGDYGSGLDYDGYGGIQLVFSPVEPGYYQIQIEYNNVSGTTDKDNAGIQVDNCNATVYLFLPFNYDYAVNDIEQIYLQNEVATTVTLTEATILVDANDGVTKVEGGTPTSISSIQTKDTVEVARYNLMGQKISGAEKGINIIVYSDGSSKKVLVK